MPPPLCDICQVRNRMLQLPCDCDDRVRSAGPT
jgi:hypothetical protein